MSNTVRERSETEEKYKWSINDIYRDDLCWKKDFEETKTLIAKASNYKGMLSKSSDTLLSYFELENELTLKFDNLINYAHRRRDEDNRNSVYQEMCGQLSSLLSSYYNAVSFETPEILNISCEVLDGFYKQNEPLLIYKKYIDRIKKKKAHILSEQEERIMALSSQLQESPDNVYSVFNDADMTFDDAVDSEGNRHQVTHGTYIPLVQSSDRTLRKSAFVSMYSEYGKYKNTISAMLAAQTSKLLFNTRARRFESTLQASLEENEVPISVYHNLIDTVHNNMDYMYKYVKLRKKLLGVNELHMYDLYTPIVQNYDVKIGYEQAKETVYEALRPMGEEYLSVLKNGFDNRWIDVYENTGKTSGAYSAGAKVHPYVLLNHKDTLNCMFTLAHEMGHAIHSYYSNKNQPVIYSDYSIFVAEVASTCNEALLMEYLLNQTNDKHEKAFLINYFLEQFRTTLYRQTMFAEFELEINRMNENSEGITAEKLSDVYYDLNKLYFGDDIFIDREIALEWARIPHFYYNYYVYQYATGYSAAIALSQKILSEGKPAVENYIKFLSSGCSESPIDLLKIAGVDMSSPEPIESALKKFDKLIDEFEKLMS